MLAISSWFCYLLFTNGVLPGIYPLAAAYSRLFSPLGSLLVLLPLMMLPIITVAVLLFVIAALYTRRRFYRRALVVALIWPLLAVVFLPAMVSFVPGQRLTVEPWHRSYRTAYSTLWIDDNYGDILVFQCDVTGIFCRQVHKFHNNGFSLDAIPIDYDEQRDLLMVGGRNLAYVRSRNKQICAVDRLNGLGEDRCSVAP